MPRRRGIATPSIVEPAIPRSRGIATPPIASPPCRAVGGSTAALPGFERQSRPRLAGLTSAGPPCRAVGGSTAALPGFDRQSRPRLAGLTSADNVGQRRAVARLGWARRAGVGHVVLGL